MRVGSPGLLGGASEGDSTLLLLSCVAVKDSLEVLGEGLRAASMLRRDEGETATVKGVLGATGPAAKVLLEALAPLALAGLALAGRIITTSYCMNVARPGGTLGLLIPPACARPPLW